MLKILGPHSGGFLWGQPNATLVGRCPHCKQGTSFAPTCDPVIATVHEYGLKEVVVGYACPLCNKAVAVLWSAQTPNEQKLHVSNPLFLHLALDEYVFDYVPTLVRKEIEEALACLAVQAWNGFAAVCRRAVQAICTDLGAKATTKIKNQIGEMAKLAQLETDMTALAFQVMLTGHDGSHPHLPDVDQPRAQLLLRMLADLTYQLYTRPGQVVAAEKQRREKIDASANEGHVGITNVATGPKE